MAKTQPKPVPVHIDGAKDADRPVVLRPTDDDLFVRTGRQVIEACRLNISIEVWLSELNAMLAEVGEWATERAEQVEACYCAPRGTRTVLFFVPTAGRFDFDLADALAELSGRLVRDFNVGMVETHQVPGDEVERFLDLQSAQLIYGEHRRAHPPVEA